MSEVKRYEHYADYEALKDAFDCPLNELPDEMVDAKDYEALQQQCEKLETRIKLLNKILDNCQDALVTTDRHEMESRLIRCFDHCKQVLKGRVEE